MYNLHVQERLADVNVREKIHVFNFHFRGLKIMVEMSKENLHFFMQKTELIYLENCQFYSDLLLELLKQPIFSKKS